MPGNRTLALLHCQQNTLLPDPVQEANLPQGPRGCQASPCGSFPRGALQWPLLHSRDGSSPGEP